MAGVPPLTYLNQWRMPLAQRALRERTVRVGESRRSYRLHTRQLSR